MKGDRARVITLDISLISYRNALEQVISMALSRQKAYACFSNAHMTVEAWRSAEFQQKVNQATFTFADGMPLVFALRWLYGLRQERIAGMEFMGDVLDMAAKQDLRVFYLGSTQVILDRLLSQTQTQYPGLKVAGVLSPPFRPLSPVDNAEIADQINSSGAHIVFVGLGCPKQERWMAEVKDQIPAVLLGVGGAFEIYAGAKKRAPRWMQQIGLEWIFRLSQDPVRLFGRYLRTNSQFVYLLIKQLVKR